jgi:hypothetical protein
MDVKSLCSKVHLPSAVAHFGWEVPKMYRKLPNLGWYALSKDEQMTFNAIDLFAYNQPKEIRNDDLLLMSRCYRYYIKEHPDLLEVPAKYAEYIEAGIVNDYTQLRTNEKLWKYSRMCALENLITYKGRNYKLNELLNELGMTQFINTGVGLLTYKMINSRDFASLKLHNRHANKLLVPTYFAPNYKIATLEIFEICDMSINEMIFQTDGPGWYGKLGTNIVGSIRDLLTNEGCTWSNKIVNWVGDKKLTLHHSLQPTQCIEIWSNQSNLATNVNPLTLIKSQNLAEQLKGCLGNLTITQLGELEQVTKTDLKKYWLSSKTSEVSISGTRFTRNNDRYYYQSGKNLIEYSNFALDLTKIKKEDDVYYQFGLVIKEGETAAFKIKRKAFLNHHTLLKELSDIMLDSGMTPPNVSPNYRNYLINVIYAFNPINRVEK